MAEFKIQGQTFKMESSAKDFLEKYISRIDKYAKSHHISDDVLDDIHQSVLEKLFEIKWEITQKKLVKIVNSIWEPEDIFDEESLWIDTSPKKPQIESKYRPRILWVCAWLAELMNIPVRILRLIFFILIFTYSFGIWLYLIIFLIRFITDRELASASISNWVKRIISRLWDWIRFLWKVVKRWFILCCALFLIWIIVWLWVVLYYLITGFIYSNIDYSALFPAITKRWVASGIVSAFIFLLALIWILFKKKFTNNAALIIAIWCGILAFVIAFISIWEIKEIFGNYEPRVTKETFVEIPSTDEPLEILVKNTDSYPNFLFSEPRFVNLFASDDNKLKAVYTFYFRNWNDEHVTKAIENVSDLEYEWVWDNRLMIQLKDGKLFNKKTPAVPTNISIDLYIPKDLEIKLVNVWYMTDPVEAPVWMKDLWTRSYHTCDAIRYNAKTESFYCTYVMTSNDKYNIALINLKRMADEISPLKWLHPSRSQSSTEQYWVVDSINITDDNKLLAKLSDQFFNFFMVIEYTIDEETGEFRVLSSKLKDVEQKWLMDDERMKNYEWRENLLGFEIQMKEEDEEISG